MQTLERPASVEERVKSISEREFDELVDFLKVLADRTRLRILGLLSEREYTVKEMAATLGLKEPTISLHLNMLKAREMVRMRPEGTSHYYSLRQESIFALLQEVSRRAKEEVAEDTGSSEFERQVLSHFFEGGRLKEIPTRRSRQLVVLRRLAKEFEVGRRYHELEVNAILKAFHPDCATLRRYLVDNRIMARSESFYWRLEEAP